MAQRLNEFLELQNHRQVRRILEGFCEGADISWFDRVAVAVCKQWLRLAQHHLQVARSLVNSNRNWRSVVSRSYYAAYTASRTIRFYVEGSIKLDVDDHKKWEIYRMIFQRNRSGPTSWLNFVETVTLQIMNPGSMFESLSLTAHRMR
jgi:hypothetical protein